mgnify:CR=1 FL=1
MAIRSSTDDAHLVQEAARGNQVAFRQLYERYYRPMASVIFRVGGTFVDVDDVLQDVFLRAWNGLPGFRQDAQFSTWLYRIAVNTALRHREKRKAERDRTQEDLEGNSHFLEAGESPTEATRQALLDPADVAINANQALVLRGAQQQVGRQHVVAAIVVIKEVEPVAAFELQANRHPGQHRHGAGQPPHPPGGLPELSGLVPGTHTQGDEKGQTLEPDPRACVPAEIGDLLAIIRQLKSEGVGIVYISHKMDEIQRIADRITVMRDGAYIATVPAATTPMAEVIAMMVGRHLEASDKVIPDTSCNEVLLEVHGLKRGRAIRDVSFRVRRGEIVGFAGLMGAGRTEVARAVFGADPIEAGEVRVAGKAVRLRSPQDAVAAGIGYLSEDRKHFGLATGMDVAANITLPSLARWLRGGMFLNKTAIAEVSRGMVDKLRIKTPSIYQMSKLLSGGNQQKVVIARAMSRKPRVLVAVNPTRGLDVGAIAYVHRALRAATAAGCAVVLISTELDEILALSDRIAVLYEGRLSETVPAGVGKADLGRLMGGAVA